MAVQLRIVIVGMSHRRDTVNTPTVYVHGPHAYKIEAMGDKLVLRYALFNEHGWAPVHRPGRPNAHPWRASHHRFTTVNDVHVYARSLFNGVSS